MEGVPEAEGNAERPFEVWVDAQLPPFLAAWLREDHDLVASHLEDLGLLTASDSDIFTAATSSERRVVIVTKDSDFSPVGPATCCMGQGYGRVTPPRGGSAP